MKNNDSSSCFPSDVTASCLPKTSAGTATTINDMDKSRLREEIDALRDYDPDKLRRRYHELTGSEAGTLGTRFLQRRCAHRLQEIALGGLSSAELETLAYIAAHDPQINKSLRSAPRSANDSRGVVFRRNYHGRVYEMRALGNGRYEYESKIYTSPTAVVRAITGRRHYNGVRWWGLKPKKD